MRIASLLPAATEIVRALGLADRLVGVTFECASEARARCPVVVDTAIPPGLAPAEIDAWVRDRAARGLPMYELDRAALAALRPDLILTQDLCRVCALPAGTVADACRLIGTDAEVLSLDPHTLDEVLDAVGAVGRAAGASVTRRDAGRRTPGAAVGRRACGRRAAPAPGTWSWSGPIRRSSPATGCPSWCRGPAASRWAGRRVAGA